MKPFGLAFAAFAVTTYVAAIGASLLSRSDAKAQTGIGQKHHTPAVILVALSKGSGRTPLNPTRLKSGKPEDSIPNLKKIEWINRQFR